MENTMTVMQGILNNLRKKYNQVNNIYNLTRDMEDALQKRDEHSFGMLLDMRQDVMKLVDQGDTENAKRLERLPSQVRDRVEKALKPTGEPIRLENPLETDLFDTNQRIVALLGKVIALDDSIQQKLNSLK